MQYIKNKFTNIAKKPSTFLVIGIVSLLIGFHIFILLSSDTRQTIILQNSIIDGSKDEVEQKAKQKLNTFILVSETSTIEQDLSQAGITFNTDGVSSQIENAWSWQNFIPILGTWRLLKDTEIVPEYTIDELQLSKVSLTLAEDLAIKPSDAHFSKDNENIVIVPETFGATFDAKEIQNIMTNALINDKVPAARIEGVPVEPKVLSETLEPLLSQYEKIITTPPIIKIDGKDMEVSESLVSELVTVENSNIVLNADTVDELISDWNKSLGKPAGTTTVNYLDGVITDKTLGSTGLTLDKDKVIAAFQIWFTNPENNIINLSMQQSQPDTIENREYSAINGPIQKAIDDWLSRNTGTYAVSFREIGGNNRIAGYKSATSNVMASTYKMFLSTVAYQMIESGELSAAKIIYNGKNVYDCISGAITYSENECIVELGWFIGWEKANQKIANLGISGVNMNNYNSDRSYNGDKTATADSMAKLLQLLQTGSLLNSTHTSQLLSYMKNQIYRDGIPSGSTGTVANKVGFLDAYKHDMAIVDNGSTKYILVILSNNSSWQKIADLSRTISGSL